MPSTSSRARWPTPRAKPAWPDGGEAEQPDVVAGTAPLGRRLEQQERERLGHDHVVDRVVEAAGAGQAHDVPVAPELGALLGQEHHPHGRQPELADRGLAVDHLHDPGTQPVGVARAAAELVVARHQVAVVDRGRLAHRARASRRGCPARAEHGPHRLVGRVDRGEARRGGVGHGRPPGRAVRVGQLLEHLERGGGVGLEPADLGGHQQPEQAGVGEGVDDLGGHGAVQLGALGVGLDQRAQGAGPLDGRRISGARRRRHRRRRRAAQR